MNADLLFLLMVLAAAAPVAAVAYWRGVWKPARTFRGLPETVSPPSKEEQDSTVPETRVLDCAALEKRLWEIRFA